MKHPRPLHRLTPLAVCLLFGLMLASCAPGTPGQPTATQSPATPIPTQESPTLAATLPAPTAAPLPAISDADWSRGPKDARVTIVVYSDFQ